jgi:hypothetical protein
MYGLRKDDQYRSSPMDRSKDDQAGPPAAAPAGAPTSGVTAVVVPTGVLALAVEKGKPARVWGRTAAVVPVATTALMSCSREAAAVWTVVMAIAKSVRATPMVDKAPTVVPPRAATVVPAVMPVGVLSPAVEK